ncbi:MAG: thiamine-phosphate synthase family protein [Methanoregula sp.]|jgi:hydroxymethylpyrimidine/phosphomethylpyrimidine kinase
MISPEQQRTEVLAELSRVVTLLSESLAPVLVSGAGTNIGYAIRGARDASGVAAVAGGFIVQENAVVAAGPCGFGADAEMTKVLLTAMKFDPDIRCAATLHYTKDAGRILEDMFLEYCTVNRRLQPPGVSSTMDWGVASCCKDGVPEVIMDPGTTESLAKIHLFGENPTDVSGNTIMLSNRIIRIEL